MAVLDAAHLEPLQAALGYAFRDASQLARALVHTSFANEWPNRAPESNERLEFLGDAVLGIVVAHHLYLQRPAASEGELSVLRAWLVRQATLAHWAREVELGATIQFGRGETREGGRERPAILASAFEAVLGAAYLDGGLEAARAILLPRVDRTLASGEAPGLVVDAKSRLQQVAQARFNVTPSYRLVEQSGSGHEPWFVFEVDAGPGIYARGAGGSKQAAQQVAAQAALVTLDAAGEQPEPALEAAETAAHPVGNP